MSNVSLSMRSLIAEFDKQWDDGFYPDIGKFLAAHEPLLPSQLSHLLLIDQSRRWAGGDKISAEDYFKQFPDLLNNAEAAIDLLFAEFLLQEESDPTISVDTFTCRYPQFADELRRQVEFHRTIGSELIHNNSPESAESENSNSGGVANNEVPGYEILGELGRGGLGIVYLARNVQLNRKVALKMLLAGKFASKNLLKRLFLEAEATARLQHPNIVQIYEVGQHDGYPFLAFEYISGGTLAQWMERRPQPPRDAANIIREIALAIQFAHEKGVVHRDLKPSNLLIQPLPQTHTTVGGNDSAESNSARLPAPRLSYGGLQIKVADFGLAKFVGEDSAATRLPTTMTGDLMGTAAYMSPEQAKGGSIQSGLTPGKLTPLTASTDIYSLGAILYELLTGRPPFMGVQPLEVLSQVIADEPIRPSQLVRNIPKDLQTICLKCLEKNPARRYASAGLLADDLQRFLSNQPIVARKSMLIERGWRWCRRNPVRTALSALVATMILMVASLSGVYSIMLGNQLAITTQSEITEKTLKMQALHKLWESSLSQADSLRTSRQVGQRFDSLKAIDVARDLGNSIQFKPSQVDRMRNATIASLALSDLRIDRQWKRPWPEPSYPQTFDDSMAICAYLLEPSLAVVQRLNDGVELARIENAKPNSSLILSPDGTKLAILNEQCRVYELNTTSLELLFESTSGGPWAFARDCVHMIGTDGDGLLKLVNLQNPETIKTIGNFRELKQISMSPDSQYVAIGIDHSIQVVEIDTANVILRVAPPSLPEYQSFEWHPNSKLIAIRTDEHGIELWDVTGDERLRTIPASGPCRFTFSVNGNRLLTYNYWMEHLQLWTLSSGEQEFSQKGQHVHWLAADSHGGFALLQSHDSENVARVSILCPTVYQTIPALRKDSASHVVDLSYSPDGRFLAYSSRGELEIFDAHTMTSLSQAVVPGCYLRFDSSGSLLTTIPFGIDEDGHSERGLNRWRLIETTDLDSTKIAFGPPEAIFDSQAARFANAPFDVGRDGKIIAIPRVDGVSMWSTNHGKCIGTQVAHADVRRVSISPDGKRVASGGWHGGNVCVWDAETGQLQHTILDPTECTVQFSPDGKLLATNSSEITVWESQSWKELYRVKVPGQPNSGVSVCFSRDSKTLAASDSLGRIHLIDAASGQEFLLLNGPKEKHISSLHYSPDGRQLAVVSGIDLAHVWNLDAIQAELDARSLGWPTSAGMELSAQSNSAIELSVDKVASSKLPKVDILFDERFRQLEATQHVVQARMAAAKFEFDSAQAEIARAIALKPQDPHTCNDLAWLLAAGPVQLRDPEKAIELAQIAMQNVEQAKRSLYANTLGVAQYRAGKFEDALDMLKQSLAGQSPVSQSFDLYFLSMCSSQLGDRAAARDYFDRADALQDQFRSKLSYKQQMELNGFSKEAQSLLNEANL